MKKKSLLATSIHAIICSGALIATSPWVYAQGDTTANVDEVVVTGSRIKRADLTSNSPISIVDAVELKQANVSNPEEFLRSDPRFVAATGRNTNNGNDGSATVDLRNLGEERTLVLVDGKRFTPYDYQGFVDLSMIPTALIERVEVVSGGASAVYGSDAIGGVVNFIMKNDFQGVEFDASTSSTFERDGKRKDMSVTFGGNLDDGKGNIVASLGYTRSDAVTQGVRAFSKFNLDNLLEPGGSSTNPNGVLSTTKDIPALGAGAIDRLQFDSSGNLSTDVESYNYNPDNLLAAPQEKYTATLVGSYKLSDTTAFYSRVSFANNRVNTIIAPTGTFGYPYKLNVDNPFLSAATQSALAGLDAIEGEDDLDPVRNDGQVDIAFRRRLTELGTRDSLYENTAMQFVTGITGKLFDTMDWEVFVQKGRTVRTQNYINDVDYAKSQQAMLAVKDPLTGVISCQDPSGGCVPINYFGPGKITPAMANFIRFNLQENDKTDQFVTGGSITFDTPFTIPSATNPIGFAAGVEYREESARNLPDQNYATGNSIGFGSSSPVDAKLNVTEIFEEFRIPVVEDVNFAKAIVLEAAVRVASYENTVVIGDTTKNSFDNTSYKFGGEWAVNDQWRFRSIFQHAVRAPNLAEIGLPKTSSIGNLDTDYCDSGAVAPSDKTIALCEATGVPEGKVGQFSSIDTGQTNNYVSGNPNLQPEQADTLTVGVVYTAEVLPLTVSVDYYDIQIDDVIVQMKEQSVMDGCYLYDKNPTGFFCSRLHRSAETGSLYEGTETGVDVSRVNGGSRSTKGLDITANYNLDLEKSGTLSFSVNAVNVFENKQQDAAQVPSIDCVGLVGKTCLRPDPKWRITETTTWKKDGISLSLRWQYLSGLKQDAVVFGTKAASDFAMTSIPAYNYFDLFASYEVNETVTLRAGVENLLDKEPPIVGNEYGGTAENSGNTYPATYDPLGRSAFVGINARF